MASLVDVLGKTDAQELAEGFVAWTLDHHEWRGPLQKWAGQPKHREILDGGRKNSTLLRRDSRARAKLDEVLARDQEQLHSYCCAFSAEILKRAGTDSASEDRSPLPERVGQAEVSDLVEAVGGLGALVVVLSNERDVDAEILRLVAASALEQCRAAGQQPEQVAEDPPVASVEKAPANSAELKALQGEVKRLRQDLQRKAAKESKLDRANSDLRAEKKRLETAVEELESQKRRLADELDTGCRDAAKQMRAMIAEKARVERALESRQTEVAALRSELASRDEDIEAAAEWVDKLEHEVLDLERELRTVRAERDRRVAISDIFRDAQPEEALQELQNFSSRLASLEVFVSQAVAAKSALVAEAEVARETERSEREAAKHAAMAKQQEEQAWQQRLFERAEQDLDAFRSALLRSGRPDHVVVDGHNLILRRFRPDMERTKRPWLEEMVCRMSEDIGVDTHLVFDCHEELPSHAETVCPGVTRYYASKRTGGADARIAEIVREFRHEDRTVVVSSDHRHVWADSHRAVEQGYDVSVIDVELLHNYLVALDKCHELETVA